MSRCIHPVQFLSHTVVSTALPKTHALYREHHKTVCTQCMSVILDRFCTSSDLGAEWSDSK